jgi:hypothetical protein
MDKVKIYAILAILLVSFLLLGTYGQAATYYIAGNGSDSNSGTSKNKPWLHAPGMTGCSGNCANNTPSPGDNFIFKGGDTWYVAGGTPVSLPWFWQWNGTSGSRIYVGVDATWYTGGSWTRPKMSGGNPINASKTLSSCPHNFGGGYGFLRLSSGSTYTTFDNFEFLGMCWSGSDKPGYIDNIGSYNTVQNMYVHGWSHVGAGGGGGAGYVGNSNATLGAGNQWVSNTCDGSDSDYNSFSCQLWDCHDVHNGVYRYASQGFVCNNMHRFYNNLIEYIYNSDVPGVHSNGFEFNSEWDTPGWGANLVYNNVVRHITSSVTAWVNPGNNLPSYYFNNLIYDTIAEDMSVDTSAGSNMRGYWINNTFVGGSAINECIGMTGDRTNRAFLYNNHCITKTGQCTSATFTGSTNLIQTPTQATAQGYTSSNQYAPTVGGSTINAGSDRSSYCTTAPALCYDTTLANTRTALSRPQGSGWDIGVYEYAASGPTTYNDSLGLSIKGYFIQPHLRGAGIGVSVQ